MALKSIFEIDVQDAAFKRFAATFDKYQAALKSTPAAWSAVNQNITGTRKSFDKIVDQMVAQNVQQKLIVKLQDEADRRTKSMADRWTGIARSTATVSANLRDVTSSILKWGTSSAIGGIYAIDRLAVGVSATRKSSLGLGANYGAQKSFTTNFARLLDSPESVLSGVSSALSGDRTPLSSAGLSRDQQNGDTADVAVAALRSVMRIADETNRESLEFVHSSRRLGALGITPEDFKRIKNTSQGEREDLIRQFSRGKSDFNVAPETTRAWQEFTTQMSRAGQKIENTFVVGLAPLAPNLTKLADSFSEAVKAFLHAPALKDAVDGLASGFGSLAKTISGITSGQGGNSAKIIAAVSGGLIGFRVGGIPGAAAGALVGLMAEGAGDSNPDVSAQREATLGRAAQLRKDREEGRASLWSQLADSFSSKVSGVNPDLSNRVQGLIGSVPSDLGTARITSGFRTAAEQEALRQNNPSGFPVAQGTSKHELGQAVDVSGNAAVMEYLHAHAKEFGLDFPVKGDPVHVQLMDNRGASTGQYRDQKVTIDIHNNTGNNLNYSVNGLKN